MSGVSIRKYGTKRGARWQVRYRNGGRGYKQIHAGSFDSHPAAKKRRDFCRVTLAQGNDPVTVLREGFTIEAPRPGLRVAWDSFIASKLSVSESAYSNYRSSRDRFCAVLGDAIDPAELTFMDVQRAITTLASGPRALSRKTLETYLATFRQVLDYAGAVPNPARDRRLELPPEEEKELVIPTCAMFESMLDLVRDKYPDVLLAFELMECVGLRCKEIVSLQRGDLDVAEGRLRIAKGRTKRKSGGQRWLPLPEELLNRLLIISEGRQGTETVFEGLTYSRLYYALTVAAAHVGIPCTPHVLRHRRISLWVNRNINPVQIKAWSGHTKAEMSLDTYGHVLILGDADRWGDHWETAYRATVAA